jgi:hypothetical protein
MISGVIYMMDKDYYFKTHSKSILVGLICAVLLGPIGLIYSSVREGILLSLILIPLGILFTPMLIVSWVVAVCLAPFGVIDHNNKLRSEIALITSVGKNVR